MTSRSLYRAAAVALVLSAAFTLPGFGAHPAADPGEMAGTNLADPMGIYQGSAAVGYEATVER